MSPPERAQGCGTVAQQGSGATGYVYDRERPYPLRRSVFLVNLAPVPRSPLSLKGRVARALLILAAAFGQDVGGGRILVRQKLKQNDLAAMAGIARENVSRILNDWASRSLVTRIAGYYCLENKAAIEQEAEL